LQRKYREAVLQCHANEERSMAAKRRELLGDPARVRDLQQQQYAGPRAGLPSVARQGRPAYAAL